MRKVEVELRVLFLDSSTQLLHVCSSLIRATYCLTQCVCRVTPTQNVLNVAFHRFRTHIHLCCGVDVRHRSLPVCISILILFERHDIHRLPTSLVDLRVEIVLILRVDLRVRLRLHSRQHLVDERVDVFRVNVVIQSCGSRCLT